MKTWFKDHSSAILATALVVSKAGVLGTAAKSLAAIIAAACAGLN